METASKPGSNECYGGNMESVGDLVKTCLEAVAQSHHVARVGAEGRAECMNGSRWSFVTRWV